MFQPFFSDLGLSVCHDHVVGDGLIRHMNSVLIEGELVNCYPAVAQHRKNRDYVQSILEDVEQFEKSGRIVTNALAKSRKM